MSVTDKADTEANKIREVAFQNAYTAKRCITFKDWPMLLERKTI